MVTWGESSLIPSLSIHWSEGLETHNLHIELTLWRRLVGCVQLDTSPTDTRGDLGGTEVSYSTALGGGWLGILDEDGLTHSLTLRCGGSTAGRLIVATLCAP